MVRGGGGGGGGLFVEHPMSVSMPMCVLAFVIHVAARRFSLSLRT